MTSMRFPAMLRQRVIATLGLFLLLSLGGALHAQSSTATAPAVANNTSAKQATSSEAEYWFSAPVVKFGAALGMKPETASNVFDIFNILILVVGVGYGLLKFLPKAFRNRGTAIQKHLIDARTATEEATTRLSSVEERLSRLDDQIAAMRLQAEADIARDEERIKATVEEEKNKILAAAEAEIQSATTSARREIQKYAAELAIDQATRKLVVSAETDRLLVEHFAHKLGEGSNN
ncbi:MAG: ATP synthase F0 subunit B [Acidobacteriaceae bacterium]